jgi:DnaK suppressor protein
MELKEKAELKKRIRQLIHEMEYEISLLEDHVKPISPENSLGRISRMDAINNKGVAEVSMRNKKSKLSKLRVALENIDKDDFGRCSNCGNTIQAGRLMFLPESTRCMKCASR